MFQHTAARRRLIQSNQQFFFIGCFNTQPPEGGWAENEKRKQELAVSTHSRPKAAACRESRIKGDSAFQHTAARRRLVLVKKHNAREELFQHTAARRRLSLS